MSEAIEPEASGKVFGGNVALWVMVAILGGGSGVQLVSWNSIRDTVVTRGVFEEYRNHNAKQLDSVVLSIEGLRQDLRTITEREGPMLTRIALLEHEVQELRKQLDAQRR